MNLKDMTLEQVMARIAELDNVVRSATSVEDIDKAAGEKQELLARKAELEALDKRRKTALELNGGKPAIPVEGRSMGISTGSIADTPEYRTAFLLNLQGRELTREQRALVTASAAIPTQTWGKIVEEMEAVSPLVKAVTVSSIPGNLTIPVESSAGDAAWVAMGTASSDSSDALTYVSLSAYKLIKTVEIGADVRAMAIADFENYIVRQLSRKKVKAVENAIVNGSGTNQPTGLAGAITNTGTFTKAGMTFSDLLAIIANLPDAGYRQSASFLMPSALFYTDVLNALASKSIGLDVQAAEKLRVFNYPVILCDRLAANTLIFGDFSYYHFNWASPVEIAADNSVGFRTGSTVYRAMALADGKPLLAAAFNKYTRSAT
jgi:HK97 family phage major capsid protein